MDGIITSGCDGGHDVGVLLQRLHAFLLVHVVADALLDQVLHLHARADVHRAELAYPNGGRSQLLNQIVIMLCERTSRM